MVSPMQYLLGSTLGTAVRLVGGIVMCFWTSWQLSVLAFATVGPIIYLTKVGAVWDAEGCARALRLPPPPPPLILNLSHVSILPPPPPRFMQHGPARSTRASGPPSARHLKLRQSLLAIFALCAPFRLSCSRWAVTMMPPSARCKRVGLSLLAFFVSLPGV